MIQDEAQTIQAALDLCDNQDSQGFSLSAAPVASTGRGQPANKMASPDQVLRARKAQRQRMLTCRRCNMPNHYSFYCTANDNELNYLQRRKNRSPNNNNGGNQMRRGNPQGSSGGAPRFNGQSTSNQSSAARFRNGQQQGFKRRHVNAVTEGSDQRLEEEDHPENQQGSSVNTVEFPFLAALDRKQL